MKLRKLSYVPGLYKTFDEILVNAADNKQRDDTMDEIRVDIDREIYSAGVQTAFCGLLGGMSDPLQLPALLPEVVWTGAAWQCSLGTPQRQKSSED